MKAAGNIQQTHMVCFTDRSVVGGGAGVGMAFGFDPGGLGNMATVFHSLVYALQAVKWITGKNIEIFSDI